MENYNIKILLSNFLVIKIYNQILIYEGFCFSFELFKRFKIVYFIILIYFVYRRVILVNFGLFIVFNYLFLKENDVFFNERYKNIEYMFNCLVG